MKVDFCVPETRADLKFIQRQTRYSSDVILNRRVVDRIVKMGIAHVFLKVLSISISKTKHNAEQ